MGAGRPRDGEGCYSLFKERWWAVSTVHLMGGAVVPPVPANAFCKLTLT
jgi:hypothetical protein